MLSAQPFGSLPPSLHSPVSRGHLHCSYSPPILVVVDLCHSLSLKERLLRR